MELDSKIKLGGAYIDSATGELARVVATGTMEIGEGKWTEAVFLMVAGGKFVGRDRGRFLKRYSLAGDAEPQTQSRDDDIVDAEVGKTITDVPPAEDVPSPQVPEENGTSEAPAASAPLSEDTGGGDYAGGGASGDYSSSSGE